VHRRVRPARPAIAGRVALSGAAVLALGAGPFVGLASAGPAVVAHDEAGAASTTVPIAGSTDAGGPGDVLWYGLLTTAAVAGAAGAHQFVGGRHRRRA
jgi:hypothetical protein